MSRIRFSDQVHHSNEYGDNYYRNDHSLRTPSDVLHTPNDYIQDDYYSKPGYGENDLLLGSYQGRSYHHHGRPHRKVRKERSFDSLPLSEYGSPVDGGYGQSSGHGTLPRRLKTSKTTYFSPGVRAAQEVSAAAAYHLNRPSSATTLPKFDRPDYLDGPNLDETCFNFQQTDTDPYYAMREMLPMPGQTGGQPPPQTSSSYLAPTVSGHSIGGSILKESNIDNEYGEGYNYDDNKSSHLYSNDGGRVQPTHAGSNYSSSSPRSAMSAESMGGGSYGRQQTGGILKKESILKKAYTDKSVDPLRRSSGTNSYNYIMFLKVNVKTKNSRNFNFRHKIIFKQYIRFY